MTLRPEMTQGPMSENTFFILFGVTWLVAMAYGLSAWRLLARMGCDQGQGYFMSRPVPSERLIEWIGNWRAPENLVKAASLAE